MQGVTIAVAGASNAGKSTLLNRLLGRNMSITSSRPHTTQKTLTFLHDNGSLWLDGRGTSSHMRIANAPATSVMPHADVTLLVIDSRHSWNETMRAEAHRHYGTRDGHLYVVLNKIDKVQKSKLLPLADDLCVLLKADGCFMVSAKTGSGCDGLWYQLQQHKQKIDTAHRDVLPPPMNDEQLAREFTREALFYLLRDELPYEIYVSSQSFEQEGTRLIVTQELLTDKKSRKAMMIGKKGAMIKQIGSMTRLRMRAFFQKKVDVFLTVRLIKHGQFISLQQEELRGSL